MAWFGRYSTEALRPGAIYREVAHCARTQTGRRVGKILLGAALVHIGFKLYSRYKRAQHRRQWEKAGKDVVVLHQFQRATNTPNLSPFALKLETFLRMADIKYIVDFDYPQSDRTQKCPWVTINGIELNDTELIMDYLTKHFNRPIAEDLTPAQRATGRAVQIMMDEHTIVLVALKRYVIDNFEHVLKWLSKQYRTMFWLLWPLLKGQMKQFFYIQGAGRFTEQEAMFFLYRDLRALQDLIGNKPFLLSEAPTSYDAAVFAELTQVIYGCAPEVERHVRANYGALVQYHERMKAKFWPDWEQCRAE